MFYSKHDRARLAETKLQQDVKVASVVKGGGLCDGIFGLDNK